MTREVTAEKSDPTTIASLALDAIEAGNYEVLADDVSRWVKAQLSGDLTLLFTERL